MTDFHLLTVLMFLPLLGAVLIALFVGGKDEKAISISSRNAGLCVALATFFLSLFLWVGFQYGNSGFQFSEKFEWVTGYKIFYHIGVDGISFFFILLTTFLMPICLLAGWNTVTFRTKEYVVAFLVMETFIIGVFCALDLLLFYLFFEAVLIPMFIIIGIWGGDKKVYASFKFFLYTLAGSVLLLVAILYIYNITGTTDMISLMRELPLLPLSIQKWLWLAMFASLAVKVPMWPVHTWLPDAHVQAPTAGSVILAGILLKLGGYGFLRLALPMLPLASQHFANLIFILSVIAIIYTSLVALMQKDMKKMIAYSSVAHMGFVTIGAFAFNRQGIDGSIFVMISHGLVSAALFICVGVLYDRLHTKEIHKYGGVASKMPVFAAVFMFFTMASVGLPGTSGFVGELLAMIGVYQVNKIVALLAATGVVLGAVYMLWLYKRVMFGVVSNKDILKFSDLEVREVIIFVPIIVLVILLGVYPSIISDVTGPSVEYLMEQIKYGVGVVR